MSGFCKIRVGLRLEAWEKSCGMEADDGDRVLEVPIRTELGPSHLHQWNGKYKTRIPNDSLGC